MLDQTTKTLIACALAEDVGSGDVTTTALIPADLRAAGRVLARQRLMVCGQEVAAYVCHLIDPELEYRPLIPDGQFAADGEVMAEVAGRFGAILQAERLLLNFLQRLSGIATMTSQLVSAVSHTGVKLLDTRKTTPGWRTLEKYAVKVGGGTNHRIGLFDQVLIKNNHIDAVGGDVAGAIKRCRAAVPSSMKVEVEVRNFAELAAALTAGPDIIMLDNMDVAQLRQAVAQIRSTPGGERILIEASGGIGPESVVRVAESGVDALSMGMLTHSVKAADISLRFASKPRTDGAS